MNILDLSGAVVRSIIKNSEEDNSILDLETVRVLTLYQIFKYKKMFSGPFIVAIDSNFYWRKDLFPNYKKNRKKLRDTFNFEWAEYQKYLRIVVQECKKNLPYFILEVDNAEADDIIYVLTTKLNTNIIIISSDKDFLQIQKINPKVRQFSLAHNDFITLETNEYNLEEHIIRGDSTDGIPNIKSDDDVFLCDDKKQNRVTKKWIESKEYLSDQYIKKYKRNQQLIDMSFIPKDIEQKIIKEFKSYKPTGKGTMSNYLIENRLAYYLKDINLL